MLRQVSAARYCNEEKIVLRPGIQIQKKKVKEEEGYGDVSYNRGKESKNLWQGLARSCLFQNRCDV